MQAPEYANGSGRASSALSVSGFWIGLVAISGLLGYLTLGDAGRSFDLHAFYTAGVFLLHDPARMFDAGAQMRFQDAAFGHLGNMVLFYHPSYEALLYAPLTLLSYKTAYFVYMGWNLLLLVACYALAPQAASPAVARWPRPMLFFLSLPVMLCLIEGQNSILFLLVLCLVWKSLEGGEDARAGALLALMLCKLPLVLPIALLLGVRTRRFWAGFLPVAGAMALLCVAINGWQGTMDFVHLVAGASIASGQVNSAQRVIAVFPKQMPNLTGLLYVCGTGALSAKAAFGVNAAVSLALLAGCGYLVRRVAHVSTALCVAILCALLVSHHLFLYDFAVMLLPVFLLRGRAQGWLTAAWFGLPFALFAVWQLRMFSLAAVVPMLFLWGCFYDLRERSSALPAPVAVSGGERAVEAG